VVWAAPAWIAGHDLAVLPAAWARGGVSPAAAFTMGLCDQFAV